MAEASSTELDFARLRALGRKKPRTKAGQVRQAWPEIRNLLAAGHSLKDICSWLSEIGIEIGYARLSDYVNQLRRAEADRPPSGSETVEITATTPIPPPAVPPLQPVYQPKQTSKSKRDPLANLRRSEAKRPGFHYRPADPADEKDLI